jgi:hypothetical protein
MCCWTHVSILLEILKYRWVAQGGHCWHPEGVFREWTDSFTHSWVDWEGVMSTEIEATRFSWGTWKVTNRGAWHPPGNCHHKAWRLVYNLQSGERVITIQTPLLKQLPGCSPHHPQSGEFYLSLHSLPPTPRDVSLTASIWALYRKEIFFLKNNYNCQTANGKKYSRASYSLAC